MELVDKGLNTTQISSKQQLDHMMILNFIRDNQIKLSSLQILIGGSSRIQNIQQRLITKFGPTNFKFNLNLDEAIVYGSCDYCKCFGSLKINNSLLKF